MTSASMRGITAIDTSVASLWFHEREPEAGEYLRMVAGRTLALPAVVAAELLQGAYRGGWSMSNVASLRAYISGFEFLDVTWDTVESWALLRDECRRRGIGVTENDAWVAATALSLGGFLVTHDRDHLRMQAAVPRLRVLSLLTV